MLLEAALDQAVYKKVQSRVLGLAIATAEALVSLDPNEVPREDADGRSAADEQLILQPEVE